jgi:hypothetical protein
MVEEADTAGSGDVLNGGPHYAGPFAWRVE